MELTKIQKIQLRGMMMSREWEAFVALISILEKKWSEDEVKAETEFNTVWNLAKKEGKLEALRSLLEILQNEATSVTN